MSPAATRWLRWLVVIVAAVAIYLASARPASGLLSLPFPHADKAMHAISYAVFAGIILRALNMGAPQPLSAALLVLGVALAAAYGATDEFHQRFVPGRSCDAFDWLADAGGATLAALLWRPLASRVPWLK